MVDADKVRRGPSTDPVSAKGRQQLRRIWSTCRQSSNSLGAGNSLGLRTRACSSPRGSTGFKISSVWPKNPTIPSRSVCVVHVGRDRRKRQHPHRSCAGRVDGGPAGGPRHLPQGFPLLLPHIPFLADGRDQLALGGGFKVPGVHVRWKPLRGRSCQRHDGSGVRVFRLSRIGLAKVTLSPHSR